MLTPKQIKNHEFQLAGRNAYRASDVDDFMAEIYESYEQMFRENAELVKKLSLLADKVSEYKNDEDNIRNALLMAERMKDSILAEAQDKAKAALAATEERVRAAKEAVDEKTATILQNANAEADEILSDANARAEETLKLAQSNATNLLAKAQEIYDEQVNTIKEEAEKEQAYLNRIKAESVKVRMELLDTYKTQIQILEYTPDFSEEVQEMRKKHTLLEETESVEESLEENAEEIAETAAEELVEESNEDTAIVLESVSRVDDCLVEDNYVSLPDDDTEYNEDDEDTVYTPDDMEFEVEDSEEEEDPTLF